MVPVHAIHSKSNLLPRPVKLMVPLLKRRSKCKSKMMGQYGCWGHFHPTTIPDPSFCFYTRSIPVKYCDALCTNNIYVILYATGISSSLCGRGDGDTRYPVLF